MLKQSSETIGSAKRRVVVTGIGAVTPLGLTMEKTWQGVLQKRLVAGPVTHFDASEMPSRIAFEIKDFKLDDRLVSAAEKDHLNLASSFGINAATEAITQARLSELTPASRARTTVCMGVGMFSPGFDWYRDVMIDGHLNEATLKPHVRCWPHMFSGIVARMAGAQGGSVTVHTACASSGQSVGEAYEMVAHGDADVVITGGTDSMINPYHMAGFCLLGALSKRNDDPTNASRPFDMDRDGFVLGEGACVMVLEDYEHARDRGAEIIAEICGYGVTESAYRITDLHPDGLGPIEAMQEAIKDAGILPQDIGYLNAHGTSTKINDRCESIAVRHVFGAGSVAPKVSSTKSLTGHLISAAGAIELAFCIMALRDQTLPPSANLLTQDPDCPVSLCAPEPVKATLNFALSNSVGFGGSNTALIAKRTVGGAP